jgi:hypothetical protein
MRRSPAPTAVFSLLIEWDLVLGKVSADGEKY